MIHVDPAHIAPASADPPAPADARALIDAQQVMLMRLAEIGMEIAEACGREAKAAPVEAGLAFARVARAVRMTIALQSRLMKDLAALDRADEAAERARKTRRRTRLAHMVEDAARAKVAAKRAAGQQYWDEDQVEDEVEQLSSEAYERLIDAEDGDLWGRPFSEVVAGVAADLGLSPDRTARLLAAAQAPAEACADAPLSSQASGSPAFGRPPSAAPLPDHEPPPGPAWGRAGAPPGAPAPEP